MYSERLPYDGLVVREPFLISGLDVPSVGCITCCVFFNCKECQHAARTIWLDGLIGEVVFGPKSVVTSASASKK